MSPACYTRFLPLPVLIVPAQCCCACWLCSLGRFGRRAKASPPLFASFYPIAMNLSSLQGFVTSHTCLHLSLHPPATSVSSQSLCIWLLDFLLTQCLPPVGGTCTRCLEAWGSLAPSAGPSLAHWPWPGCWSTSPSGRVWSGQARYSVRAGSFGAASHGSSQCPSDLILFKCL